MSSNTSVLLEGSALAEDSCCSNTSYYPSQGTIKREQPKIGRNDPCLCGSEIKIKNVVVNTHNRQHNLVLRSISSGASNLPNLNVDGRSTLVLVKRIEDYQRAKGSKVVDGWIGAHGNTLKAILIDAGLNSGTSRMTFILSQLKPVNLTSINVEAFLTLYSAQYGAQSANDKDGLRYFIKTAKADAAVKSLNEFAYMLATTKHVTAHTLREIGEYGKGASRSYGKEITVTDPATKKVYKISITAGDTTINELIINSATVPTQIKKLEAYFKVGQTMRLCLVV